MRKLLAFTTVSLLLQTTAARSETTLPRLVDVLGQVTAASRPVEDALVVAFGLKSFHSHQSISDRSGAFRLDALPSDVYRLIAVKHGFAPAVVTVIPSSSPGVRVTMRLKEGPASAEAMNQIWEIRRSLPADVLRELDDVMGEKSAPAEVSDRFRLRGQMESLAGVAMQSAPTDYAQTAVELNGAANGWSLDIAGRLHQTEEPPAASQPGRIGQSSGISMAWKTSSEQSVRIATMKNWLRLNDEGEDVAPVDLQSHRIEWSRPDTNVEVRYLSQQNLFRSPEMSSEKFELAGRRELAHSERSDWNVDFQVWQQNPLAPASSATYRSANIGTSGHYALNDALNLHYGIRARVSSLGQQWAPETGAEIRLSKRNALVVSGLYAAGASVEPSMLPVVTTSEELGSIAPRYRYSIGLVSSDRQGNELSAVMTVAAIDSVVTMLFDDPTSTASMWDGYFLHSGDVHRDVTVTFRRNMKNTLFVDVTTTAAQTESAASAVRETRHFVVSSVRSMYRPSGTSVDVTYRLAEQSDRELSSIEANGQRLNLRVGQSLHLPLDLRLLVGIDLARRTSADETVRTADELQRRYVGGVSLAF